MKKMIVFIAALLMAAGSWAQQAGTQAVNGDNVPIEEYVPKVIIEGKWGTGPGEFGVAWTYASDTDSPMSPSGSKSMPIYPSSLAVDGKGNIYVLDAINNRIQKFDAEGKFLKAIAADAYMGEEQPIWYGKVKAEDGREILDRVDSKGKSGRTIGVDSWFPYYWPITVEGINIVIDSKDTLYYYLKRAKDGKETGEVWEFRKDKLVRKYPLSGEQKPESKFKLNPIGNNQWELTVVESPSPTKPQKHRVRIKKEKEVPQIIVEDDSGRLISKIDLNPSAESFKAKSKHARIKHDIYLEKILDNGNFRVRIVEGPVDGIVTEEREYTSEGKLVRRIKSPPGYSHGIAVGESGIRVVRWVIQKSN